MKDIVMTHLIHSCMHHAVAPQAAPGVWLLRTSIVAAVCWEETSPTSLKVAAVRMGNTRLGDYAVYLGKKNESHPKAPWYLMLQPLTDAASAALPAAPALPQASSDGDSGGKGDGDDSDDDGSSGGGGGGGGRESTSDDEDAGGGGSAGDQLAALATFLAACKADASAERQQLLLRGSLPADYFERAAAEQLQALPVDWEARHCRLTRQTFQGLVRKLLAVMKVRGAVKALRLRSLVALARYAQHPMSQHYHCPAWMHGYCAAGMVC